MPIWSSDSPPNVAIPFALLSAAPPLETHLRAMLGPDAHYREVQREATEAVTEDGSRALLVQRTGWGKSLLS